MGLAGFLLALVQPIVARVLVALGFSLVTYVGMDVMMGQVTAAALAAWGALPANLLLLAGLAGIGQGLAIIFGAIATRVLIWQLTKSTRMLMSNPG
jgi:hypothetical protein